MDQDSRAVDSRERAVSSEPCSTRPNPFDEDDLSSRKRRRTSLTDSRGRSVDTDQATPPEQATTASPLELSADQAPGAMVDTERPATPRTPEQTADRAPAPPMSGRVTLNLRSGQRPLEAIPSSPVSPSREASDSPLRAENVKMSVEDTETTEMADPALDPTVDQPASSDWEPEDGASPATLELLPHTDDDDDLDFDDGEPAVAIIRDGSLRPDPTENVPYHDAAQETLADTIVRLSQYLTNQPFVDENVICGLRDYIDNYLQYVDAAGYHVAFVSYVNHRNLWQTFPDLVWTLAQKKIPFTKTREGRQCVAEFYISFAKLTAWFVTFDMRTLSQLGPEERRIPDLISPLFVNPLGVLTRRDEVGFATYQQDSELPEIGEILDRLYVTAGGSVFTLMRLVQLQIGLIPRFPKMVEHIGAYCCLFNAVIRECSRRLLQPMGYGSQVTDQARRSFMACYQVFRIVSDALKMTMDRFVTSLTPDAATTQITNLTDVFSLVLAHQHRISAEVWAAHLSDGKLPAESVFELPADIVKTHRAVNPGIPSMHTAEVVSHEWRFNMLSKLIMSSQMQLKVHAVTTMCQDLVQFWKKFSEGPEEQRNPAVLDYFAGYLLRTGLVDYIIGPACHPEITVESSNIVGFLVVTKTYTTKQTDQLWHTVTSSQNPRVSEALIKMMGRITNLFPYEALLYVCQKLQQLPIDAFTPSMREFCENIFVWLFKNRLQMERPSAADASPYELCLRLLRESSVSKPGALIAYPEIQNFAIGRFSEMMTQNISLPTPSVLREIYQGCIGDIASKSGTTLGSLWGIYLASRRFHNRDLQVLVAEHNIADLLVDELDHAIAISRVNSCGAVLAGPVNNPRRELLATVVLHQPAMLSQELGLKLWDLLVGSGAACQEDRKMAWQLLNSAFRRAPENPFLDTCFKTFLPTLPPQYFCDGALEFVREAILPQLRDEKELKEDGATILDVESAEPENTGIGHLWRMILAGLDQVVVNGAIRILVSDVYVDSELIMSFPQVRARRVHLGLLNRCLRQLESAAQKLKAFSGGSSTSGEDEAMVIVATDAQVLEQELIFTRSLAVLREFLWAHQGKPHFAAPDLRSLMSETPNTIEGDPADLKYQSFDGNNRTEVKELKIGRRNTAASLLASLREATGFQNYRMYYRGQAFVPNENDICRSLDELQIHSGLILVRREADEMSTSPKIKPGASPLEIEISGHFKSLWGYLSMDEKLAREIYNFLVKLPADDGILDAFESPETSYVDIFPYGQPFKSLYAIHALREYLASQRRPSLTQRLNSPKLGEDGEQNAKYAAALSRAASLIVSAIADNEVVEGCASDHMKMQVAFNLVDCFVYFLKDNRLPETVAKILDSALLERLFTIETMARENVSLIYSSELVVRSFEAILESSTISRSFWTAFKDDDGLPETLEELLVNDDRQAVRLGVGKLITAKTSSRARLLALAQVHASSPPMLTGIKHPAVEPSEFADMFWPVIDELIDRATEQPGKCEEVLGLSHHLIKELFDAKSTTLDLRQLALSTGQLLLKHYSSEDFSQPDMIDTVAQSLVDILLFVLKSLENPGSLASGTQFQRLYRELFWKHLFPHVIPEREGNHTDSIGFHNVPRVVLNSRSRFVLTEIIALLTKDDASKQFRLLKDLSDIVPFNRDDEQDDPYLYDVIFQFDRTKALRSPTGYVGLKNLSNTCYLNSLFTQLYMNVGFRRFVLNAEVQDANFAQKLLFQTQKLFSHMQNSIRRFVDPSMCVNNIKTYDDTPIDIHNQMDVDEFYNLLFDRWESQLLGSEAKKVFRSFYGGQLVQQVKSKECDHVSERLEPFSAIQCDIKGKNTLQDSLQAYVDGEIMEGDNKYKCSTCDRHVDAVKRACLKDVPDNLIFHLKRFDFNLRTLQRSKINDHFSFPTKIDMQPYTVDYLTDPSTGAKADIFELVGVLVHSGTAESGHYYSYIRERPSSHDSDNWVEFNDDVVTPWDPAQLESSCFGGVDFRHPPYDSNGAVFDKTYSAYMLFYQRSSSLESDQQLLWRSGRPSPLELDLQPDFAHTIKMENTTLLRRHCLFDATTIPFVRKMLMRPRELYGGACSDTHRLEDAAMEMALSYLDQVASRAKDTPDWDKLLACIRSLCDDCDRCCSVLVNYFGARIEPLRMMVQRSPEPMIRQDAGQLLIFALKKLRNLDRIEYGLEEDGYESDPREERTIMDSVIGIFTRIWLNFHATIRAWTETFGLITDFARLGREEAAALLSRNWLVKIVGVIQADLSLPDLTPQMTRMVNNVNRRLATRPPAYESIISLIDVLLGTLRSVIDDRFVVHELRDRTQRPVNSRRTLPWTFQETSAIMRKWPRSPVNIFVEKLVAINQNIPATDSIVGRLIRCCSEMDTQVFFTLRNNISSQITTTSNAPYLHAAALYCRLSGNPDYIVKLIIHVANQCKVLQNAEGLAFLDFLKTVFDGERNHTTESSVSVMLQSLNLLPRWAPTLLGYFDGNVRTETEEFLDTVLFDHGPTPIFEEMDGGMQRTEAMDAVAKSLGINCLVHLRDTYVARRNPAVRDTVVSIQKVIEKCEKYYVAADNDEPFIEQDQEDVKFYDLYRVVIEGLRRLTVDEVEDAESGMSPSNISTESIADFSD